MSSAIAPARVRPTSVTVIAWIFIGFGVLAMLSGVFGTIMSFLIPIPDPPAAEMVNAPLLFRLVARLFEYFGLLAVIQILVAAAMVWSGTAFLRLRAWARAVIEGITWMALIYTAVFGAFWIWTVTSMWSDMPPDDGAKMLFPLFISFGAVMIVAFAIPLIVIIRVLRGPTVRAALEPGQRDA